MSKIEATIISKEQKFWEDVKDKTTRIIFETEQEIKLNRKVLEFAVEEIEKSK